MSEARRAAEELTQLTEEMGLYDSARRIVAKVQEDMRAEDEAGGKALLRTLDSMHPEARIRFMAHTVALEREQAAALNYAETRLAELLERVEHLRGAGSPGLGGHGMTAALHYLRRRATCLRDTMLRRPHDACRGWLIHSAGIDDGTPRCPSWRRAFSR